MGKLIIIENPNLPDQWILKEDLPGMDRYLKIGTKQECMHERNRIGTRHRIITVEYRRKKQYYESSTMVTALAKIFNRVRKQINQSKTT